MKKIDWDYETTAVFEAASLAGRDQPLRFSKGLEVGFVEQLEDGWSKGSVIRKDGGMEVKIGDYHLFSKGCDLYEL